MSIQSSVNQGIDVLTALYTQSAPYKVKQEEKAGDIAEKSLKSAIKKGAAQWEGYENDPQSLVKEMGKDPEAFKQAEQLKADAIVKKAQKVVDLRPSMKSVHNLNTAKALQGQIRKAFSPNDIASEKAFRSMNDRYRDADDFNNPYYGY